MIKIDQKYKVFSLFDRLMNLKDALLKINKKTLMEELLKNLKLSEKKIGDKKNFRFNRFVSEFK